MTKLKKHTKGLSFRIISGTVVMLVLFGLLQSLIGYSQFTRSLTRQYSETAFHTAETAATLVDGGRLQDYLDTNGSTDEYILMRDRLYTLCQKQDVTLIYVICPDAEPDISLKNVKHGIDTFVGDAEQFDDITMLGIRYNGPCP